MNCIFQKLQASLTVAFGPDLNKYDIVFKSENIFEYYFIGDLSEQDVMVRGCFDRESCILYIKLYFDGVKNTERRKEEEQKKKCYEVIGQRYESY